MSVNLQWYHCGLQNETVHNIYLGFFLCHELMCVHGTWCCLNCVWCWCNKRKHILLFFFSFLVWISNILCKKKMSGKEDMFTTYDCLFMLWMWDLNWSTQVVLEKSKEFLSCITSRNWKDKGISMIIDVIWLLLMVRKMGSS